MNPISNQMVISELGLAEFGWICFGQFLLTITAVYLIYSAREHSVTAGVLAGIGLPTIVVVGQYHLGKALFEITDDQQILLILISVISGGVGLALAATALEPEINGSLVQRQTNKTQEVNDG